MATVTQITFWEGTEAERLASTQTPSGVDFARTEKGLYFGDGVTPAAQMTIPWDTAGAAAAGDSTLRALLESEITALAHRPQSAPQSTQCRVPGTATLGTCSTSLFLESGFAATVARFFSTPAPTGASLIVQVLVNGAVAYTFTLTAGQTSFADTATSIVFPDDSLVTFNVTQVGSTIPGGNFLFTFAETAGSNSQPGDVGAVLNLQAASVTAVGATLTWDYTSNGIQADHFSTRYATGTTAPSSLAQGTAGPDVDGSTQTVTLTGLTPSTTYQVSVFPVGGDGSIGTYASTTVSTTGSVPTSYSGLISGLTVTNTSSSVIGFTWTPPADGVFKGVKIRRKNNSSSTTFTSTLDGRPAGGGLNASGAGLDYDTANGNTFADTGLNPSVPYSYALWAYDVYGNVSPSYVTLQASTVAVVTSGQGLYGLVPGAFGSPDYTTTFAGGSSLIGPPGGNTEWIWMKDGYKQQTQGANAAANVEIVTDPDGGGFNVLRLRQRLITNGPFSPTGTASWAYSQHPTWSGSAGTTGTGWYGGRAQLNGTSHQFQYGALEFTCRIGDATGKTPGSTGSTLSALANNVKGGNHMWYPTTNWPQQELDLWEIFNAGNAGINNHYLKGSPSASTQLSNAFAMNIGLWTTVTCLFEKPPAGATANGRCRVWYTQAGVNLGSGVGVPQLKFDTDPPYTDPGYNSNQWTAGNVALFLSPMQTKFVGLSLEYTGYWQDTAHTIPGAQFDAGTGTTATTRQAGSYLTKNVSLWRAP